MAKATSKEIVRRMATGRQLKWSPTGGYRQYSQHFGWQSVHQGSAKKLVKDGTVIFDCADGTTHYYRLAPVQE
jgi:hypothetical protein